MVGQLINDVLPHARIVHQTHEGRAQFHVGDILRHIAAHTAVHLLHPPSVAPAGDVGGERITFDVHKNGTDHYNSHKKIPFPDFYLDFNFIIHDFRAGIHLFSDFWAFDPAVGTDLPPLQQKTPGRMAGGPL